MLIRNAEVDGRIVDVRFGENVCEIGEIGGPAALDAGGGALIPGLHDHHLHLLAMAAAYASVDVSAGLDALRDAPGSGWVRATGWAGEGGRDELDRVVVDRPVRVQHRSGAMWALNSAACDELGLDAGGPGGVERDADGRATGRLFRLDGWLAERIGRTPPDLAGVGRRLAAWGVTGVTDATPDLADETAQMLKVAVPQRVVLLGEAAGDAPVKIVLGDSDLPDLDALAARIAAARPRPVAVHCVTRVAAVLLVTALREVGTVDGDRVEHGAVLPDELVEGMPTVVTQPGFIADRGDSYLREVEPDDLPWLYRYRTLPHVVPSSDAPYGPADPWAVMRAARDRCAPSGAVVGAGETVDAATVLDGYLRPPLDLRGTPRRVEAGVAADLVLLTVPLAQALADPRAEHVRAVWIGGVRQ